MNSGSATATSSGGNKDAVEELRRQCRGQIATFVYAARDEEYNGALVLKDYLEHQVS